MYQIIKDYMHKQTFLMFLVIEIATVIFLAIALMHSLELQAKLNEANREMYILSCEEYIGAFK